MTRRLLMIVSIAGIVTGALLFMGVPLSPEAAAASNGNVSQSYEVSTPLKEGMLVSVTSNDAHAVEAASTNNASRLLGVVVGDNSLVAVNPGTGKAQVASSGSALALVSTVNGVIAKGDAVAVSPFSGIGMKAGKVSGYIIGRAQDDFSSRSAGAKSQQVTTKAGRTQTIAVGYVHVTIAPGYYANDPSAGLTGLQRFVRSVTGRTVSMTRIIISLVIGILTITTIIILTYAATYGSIISIGRNPLASRGVLHALRFVLLLALLSTLVAFILIYFLLR